MHALYRNHMGNDLEVAVDARISFAAGTEALSWEDVNIPNCCPTVRHTKAEIPKLAAGDIGIISFLARGCRQGDWDAAAAKAADAGMDHGEAYELLKWAKRMPTHWTPFGQQQIKMRMKAPVPIRTQCFKSKIGFVENEESRRYISSTPELFVPNFRQAPAEDIKQGSGGPHKRNSLWQARYRAHCKKGLEEYDKMIKDRVAPEQARFILPQGSYVNWAWNGSLYAWAEFVNKRQDGHAQGEIQELSNHASKIAAVLFPVSWAALTE